MNLGQLVTITDLTVPMTGVITKVVPSLTLGDVTVYQVTTLTGTKWAREEADLVPATEADAAEFVRDAKILAPHHADLVEAVALISETDPATKLKARRASSRFLNKIGFDIQDNASDAGWAAAQDKIEKANEAHKAGDYAAARVLIGEAHTVAFSF